MCPKKRTLQQHLPFTVLKHILTEYMDTVSYWLQQHLPFTVLKPLTCANGTRAFPFKLQQHLPFTVLKLYKEVISLFNTAKGSLQQHLPFTVLKLDFVN